MNISYNMVQIKREENKELDKSIKNQKINQMQYLRIKKILLKVSIVL